MVIAAIIVGIVLLVTISISFYLSDKRGNDFDIGINMGFILFFLFVIEVALISSILENPKPTAMDVYQGKTTLEYTIKDSVKIDSTVVFKDIIHGKEN
jgi:riboflavin transporter FmnP